MCPLAGADLGQDDAIFSRLLVIGVLGLGLSACQMTQEVAQEMRSTTIGGQGIGSSQTQSRTTHPAPGTTVTRSTTTSASIGLPALTEDIVVCPAEWIHLVCEAQISVDDKGIIEQVRISRDMEGRGFSFSRCAEVLGT